MIDARAFLREKREGRAHAPSSIRAFIGEYVKGGVPDYQVSAWLMAAFLRGLNAEETDALTEGLLHSGRVFDWTALGRPTADKHSTGGVGDKISIPLAPIVAAAGVLVPMVSGRGLGHTGGTLDKLEAMPGFRTTLSPAEIHRQLDRLGVVMVGQGPELAPADGLLYALRDVTSTVEFEPFIVSSIVSKKIAEGAKAVVYDVKCGSGAFMKTMEQAQSLAHRLVATTRALGARSSAMITDMDWPIGVAVGNALEIVESCEVLRGGGPGDTRALTVELASEMLWLAGADPDRGSARQRAESVLSSGAAWERFLALVEAQGGDPRTLNDLPQRSRAPVVREVQAPRDGVLADCDGFAFGDLMVQLGAGRRAKEDRIDPRVGARLLRRRGDRVRAGEPFLELHMAADDLGAVARAASCFRIADDAPAPGPRIRAQID